METERHSDAEKTTLNVKGLHCHVSAYYEQKIHALKAFLN